MTHMYIYEEPRQVENHWEKRGRCRCGLNVIVRAPEPDKRFTKVVFWRTGERKQYPHYHTLPPCTYQPDEGEVLKEQPIISSRQLVKGTRHRWTLKGTTQQNGEVAQYYTCRCGAQKYRRVNPVTFAFKDNCLYISPEGESIKNPSRFPFCTRPWIKEIPDIPVPAPQRSCYSTHRWRYTPWKRAGLDTFHRMGTCAQCGLQKKEGKRASGFFLIAVNVEGVWKTNVRLNDIPCVKKEPPPGA